MRGRIVIVLVAVFIFPACVDIYNLPDPPPPSERRTVSLIPGEEERQAERDYLSARAAVVKLNGLLSQKRFREALEMVSAETRSFLTYGTEDSPEEVLAAGKLKLANGELVSFKPVSMLLAEDISKLEDTFPGVEEQETSNRKEIYAILPSGEATKIVLIQEGGQWVVHRTRLPSKIQPEG